MESFGVITSSSSPKGKLLEVGFCDKFVAVDFIPLKSCLKDSVFSLPNGRMACRRLTADKPGASYDSSSQEKPISCLTGPPVYRFVARPKSVKGRGYLNQASFQVRVEELSM